MKLFWIIFISVCVLSLTALVVLVTSGSIVYSPSNTDQQWLGISGAIFTSFAAVVVVYLLVAYFALRY
jgi:hypothetical protein